MALLGATLAMGFGVATVQTVLPSVVSAWTPRHLALGTTVYMNGMMVGEFAGAGLTLPLVVPLAGGDWRVALLYWSRPAMGGSVVMFYAINAYMGGALADALGAGATVALVPSLAIAALGVLSLLGGSAARS